MINGINELISPEREGIKHLNLLATRRDYLQFTPSRTALEALGPEPRISIFRLSPSKVKRKVSVVPALKKDSDCADSWSFAVQEHIPAE